MRRYQKKPMSNGHLEKCAYSVITASPILQEHRPVTKKSELIEIPIKSLDNGA